MGLECFIVDLCACSADATQSSNIRLGLPFGNHGLTRLEHSLSSQLDNQTVAADSHPLALACLDDRLSLLRRAESDKASSFRFALVIEQDINLANVALLALECSLKCVFVRVDTQIAHVNSVTVST